MSKTIIRHLSHLNLSLLHGTVLFVPHCILHFLRLIHSFMLQATWTLIKTGKEWLTETTFRYNIHLFSFPFYNNNTHHVFVWDKEF